MGKNITCWPAIRFDLCTHDLIHCAPPLSFSVGFLCRNIQQVSSNQDDFNAEEIFSQRYSFFVKGRPKMTSRKFKQFLTPLPHRHAFYYQGISPVVT